MAQLNWISAGSRLGGDNQAGIDLGWLNAIEPGLAERD
jgi:hypothetical protein